MKKIVITGSTGMLGRDLVRRFTASGKYDVYGVSRNIVADLPASKQFVVDFRDASPHKFPFTPDVIIHTAAITDLHLCEKDPELAEKVNVDGSRIVASWSGHRTVIYYISTDSVFDGKNCAYSEDDVPDPLNVYGRTKLAGESAVRAENIGQTSIIRTNIYGLHVPMKKSLAEWAYMEWQNGKTVTGFTDVVFNAVFTSQLANVLQILIEKNAMFPVLNIGSDEAISKFDFLDRLRQQLQIRNEKSLTKGLSTDFPGALKRPLCTSLKTGLLSTFCTVPDFESGLQGWVALATEEKLLKN